MTSRRSALLFTISPLALLAATPAAAQQNQQAVQEVERRRGRRAGRHARSVDHRRHRHPPQRPHRRRFARPGRRDLGRKPRQHRLHRGQSRADPGSAELQLPAAVDHRRHRRHPPGDAARPRPRPDAGADQRQAPPQRRPPQHQRLGRARYQRGRHQHDPDHRAQPGRSAARRRRRPIWLGRDRRRDQFPAPQRARRAARRP